ncbi:MAG: sigma 54-interacting transcriptional regulator, partial [Thermodesulfobacteriota bacterium]
KRLQAKAVAVGRGDWGDPMEVSGSDEIAQLTESFNQMLSDLSRLREKDRSSAETIAGLNRDLSAQLEKVEGLKERLLEENAALRQELLSSYGPGEIIGSDGSIMHIVEQARQLASLPVTVLITGESGTGKELLARLLHESGSMADKPFVTVNCAAMPSTLIESELFGHEKGAFTGAVTEKRGKFELADGGTLFLDEVGELPGDVQAKLLRALQHGEINRIGGEHPISVDVRIVAATNRVLAKEVSAGAFREDLYYRLKVVELHCPPLRERIEDIPALAQHFIEAFSKRLNKPVQGIAPSALNMLMSHDWPGNIRELENTIARAVALATTQVLGPEDFIFVTGRADAVHKGAEGEAAAPFERLLKLCRVTSEDLKHKGFGRLISACERICLEASLDRARNQKEAASALGMTPTKLHRLIRKHGLKGRASGSI